jgi:hypothetical protein
MSVPIGTVGGGVAARRPGQPTAARGHFREGGARFVSAACAHTCMPKRSCPLRNERVTFDSSFDAPASGDVPPRPNPI